jgi:hypothetical protein
MDRRNLIFATLATSAVSTTAYADKKNPPRSDRTVVIESPEDAQIVSIDAPVGLVKKGTTLFQLRSLEVEHAKGKIELLRDHLAILERPILDGRLDAEILHLRERMKYLADAMEASEKEIKHRNDIYRLGYGKDGDGNDYTVQNPPSLSSADQFMFLKVHTVGTSTTGPVMPAHVGTQTTAGDPEQGRTQTTSDSDSAMTNPTFKSDYDLRVEYDKNALDYADAKIKAEQAPLKKSDTIDKINLTRNKLKFLEGLLQERIAALTIVASTDGVFAPRIGENGFVKKGHLLGELAG